MGLFMRATEATGARPIISSMRLLSCGCVSMATQNMVVPTASSSHTMFIYFDLLKQATAAIYRRLNHFSLLLSQLFLNLILKTQKYLSIKTILTLFPTFWPWNTNIWTRFDLRTKFLTILTLKHQNLDTFWPNNQIFWPWNIQIYKNFDLEKTKICTNFDQKTYFDQNLYKFLLINQNVWPWNTQILTLQPKILTIKFLKIQQILTN